METPEQLMERALGMAREIAACSPQSLREVKRLVAPAARRKAPEIRLAAEINSFASTQRDGDLEEGLRAFREKRAPGFGAPKDDPES